MRRQHKWFRKERYKNKLERDVDKHKTYFSNVYFTTKEPDPRDVREHANYIIWLADRNDISLEEALALYIERNKKWKYILTAKTNIRGIYKHNQKAPFSPVFWKE